MCFTSEESLEINDIPDIKRITRQRKNLSLSREYSAETSSTSSKFTGPGEEEEDVGESSGLLPTLDADLGQPPPRERRKSGSGAHAPRNTGGTRFVRVGRPPTVRKMFERRPTVG